MSSGYHVPSGQDEDDEADDDLIVAIQELLDKLGKAGELPEVKL
jgi:hypothetical protein